MDRKRVGVVLQVVGALLVVIGLVGFFTTRGDDAEADDAGADDAGAEIPDGTTTSSSTSTTTTSTTTSSTTTTTTVAPETAEEFFDAWIAAFNGGDTDFLLARLNAATIDIWGADGCRAYLESVAGTAGEISLREVGATVEWEYRDGGVIEGATEIEGERVINEQTLVQVLHWQLVDGRWTWFTICGE